MTFAIFFVLSLGLFVGILNILPTAAPLAPTFVEAFSTIIAYMKYWNYLFPISELFISLGIVIGYEVSVWFVHALFSVYHKIRGTTQS